MSIYQDDVAAPRPRPLLKSARGTDYLPTLAGLARAAGTEVLSLVESPEGDQQTVSGSAVYDPTDRPAPFPGGVALGIGVLSSGKGLGAKLRELRSVGYVALVYKCNGASDAKLRGQARAAGIALFRASESVTWNQLMEILNVAIAPDRKTGRTLVDIRLGDLFGLANFVAMQTGGAVAIVDLEQTILAYSTLPDQPIDDTRRNGILRLHVPQSEQNDSDYRRVHAARDVVEVFTEEATLKRHAIAIRVGDSVLGSVWLLGGATIGDSNTIQVLREAANVAALHILHGRTTYISDLTRQIELVKPLLFEPDRLEFSAVRLGISASTVRVAALSTWPPQENTAANLQSRLRLFDIVRTACAVQLPSAVCGLADNIVYIVLQQASESSWQYQLDAITQMVKNTRRVLSKPVVAGLGGSVPIARVAQSRIDAEIVLAELLRNVDEGNGLVDDADIVADHESHGSWLYLRQIVTGLTAGNQLPGVYASNIAAYDARNNSSFEETLRIYFDCGGNAIKTAERLGLHVNTVRYRLSRVEPLFGLSLEDPKTRLLLWLQLWARNS